METGNGRFPTTKIYKDMIEPYSHNDQMIRKNTKSKLIIKKCR